MTETNNKIEFEMSRKLLQSVISKQTGSIVKAVKELIQNAWDAGATEIEVILTKKAVVVKDNGIGMSKSDIDKYFKVFGDTLKANNSKDIGEFGMGRGQIMPFGRCLWNTRNSSLYVDIQKFLGYREFERKQYIEGTVVICSLYKPLKWYSYDSYAYQLQKEILPGNTTITINGKRLGGNHSYKRVDNFSTKDIDVFKSSYTSKYLYVQGLSIKEFKSLTNYCINIKKKVDLNFARNNILETDPINQDLFNILGLLEKASIADQTNFKPEEGKKVLDLLLDGILTYKDINGKNILTQVNKNMLSFDDLKGKDILFGNKDIWSTDCILKGYVVLDKKYETIYRNSFATLDLDLTILDNNPRSISKRGFHRKSSIDKLKKHQIYGYLIQDINEVIIKPEMGDKLKKVSLGNSDIADSWWEKNTIYINKRIIESYSKEQIAIEVWKLLCHEYCHEYPSKSDDDHDCFSFADKFFKLISETSLHIGKYIKNLSVKYLKNKYEIY